MKIKKELEKAIEFFEIAAKEAIYHNPAQFCLPFYHSFYTIIFKKHETEEEVSKYLEEAKVVIEGSENKKQLFEAVENLANALKEARNLGSLDLESKKGELNLYRKYCENASELMNNMQETAPFATEVLKKGIPILKRNIEELIEEIHRKTEQISKQTEQISKQTKGTSFEQLGYEVNRSGQSLFTSKRSNRF
jgi:HEAT repeat protein